MQLKAGNKLHSSACDTDVMVIKVSGDVRLTCGGAEMVPARTGAATPLDPAFAGGTAMGKRYQSADGAVELLCIKPGKGTLAVNGIPLELKAVKPLPSSD